MFRFSRKVRCCCLALLLGWSLAHASVQGGQDVKAAKETQAEKIRKSLDQIVSLDYAAQSFQDVVQHLKQKTEINFVLDMFSLQQMGLGFEENPMPLLLKGERVKLRHAVQRMLNAYNLTFVILEDAVLITTEEMGLTRQLRQRVNVQVDEMPLQKALKDLARTTALNLVIDPRIAKDAQAPITLQLEDATLETAVRLLAELGGLKSVRMGNVLFVTSEARAEKIRKEEPAAAGVNLPMHGVIVHGRMFGGVGGFGGIGGNGIPQVVPGVEANPRKVQPPPANVAPPSPAAPPRLLPPAPSRLR